MKSKLKIGMPHLTYNGLDPIWLLKTLGDNHWNMLTEVSKVNIHNQRLYASFFACEIDFNKGQDAFLENAELSINSKIFKFNSQIYRSMHIASVEINSATVVMDSIFVKKDIQSGALVKDEPVLNNNVLSMDSVNSVFLDEHKKIKKKLTKLKIENFNTLTFSPETWFNGVKILYFANYLNLVLLNEYQTVNCIQQPIKKIKIFFFKNISINDKVFGHTIPTSVGNETILISNGKPICYCLVVR
jgi:probable biosynthetic protein (TIGR04098 family)